MHLHYEVMINWANKVVPARNGKYAKEFPYNMFLRFINQIGKLLSTRKFDDKPHNFGSMTVARHPELSSLH